MNLFYFNKLIQYGLNKFLEMSIPKETIKLLNIDDLKRSHLETILSNNKINIESKALNDKINDCEHCLQFIFDQSKAPKLLSAFCQECSTHTPTKYHAEGLDTHLVAVSITAEDFSSIFYDNFSELFMEINLSKDDFIQLSKVVGLYHDLGKTFARVTPSNKQNKHPIYLGHAQLGSRLIDQIEFDNKLINVHKKEIEWAINHHMCSCTHMHPIDENLNEIGIHMLMDLELEQMILSFALLSVLSYADHMARIAEDLSDHDTTIVMEHSFELFEKLLNFRKSFIDKPEQVHGLNDYNGTLTIVNYGLSGSGKSFFAKIVKSSFPNHNVIIVERDNALYEVYEKHFGTTESISYEEIYATIKEKSNFDETDPSVINYTRLVQNQWIQNLADAYDTPMKGEGNIVIIDTVQTLFPSQFSGTINSMRSKSEEAYNNYINSTRIGYYSLPIHMFGDNIPDSTSIISKTGKYFVLPDPSLKGFFFPSVFLEKEKGKVKELSSDDENKMISTISYGSGSQKLLLKYIQSYFDIQSKKLATYVDKKTDQKNLCYLLNKIISDHLLGNLEEIFNKFQSDYLNESNGKLSFISYKIEIENRDYQLVTFCYKDGLQSFNGTTRDYRGEAIMYDKLHNKFHYVRASLPVFPELSSIQKDSKAFPYITDIWDEIKSFDNPLFQTIKKNIVPKKISKLYYVPKYDGSLFNLTYICKTNPIYQIINALVAEPKNKKKILSTSYYNGENGIFLIGSKGTVFSKDPVNKRIHNAIQGSYGSVDPFLQIANDYVNKDTLFDLKNSIITLHFEAIDAIPSDELTVYYGRAWCPFFGITTYNSSTDKKNFTLPMNEYKGNFLSVADIYDCDSDWSKLRDINKSNFNKLLEGDQYIEPEGYVLHIKGENGEWISVKDKYELYYTAHKPNSKHNLKMALELSSNPKYKLVCERLAKFRYKPSIKEILSTELVNEVDNIKQIIISTSSLNESVAVPDNESVAVPDNESVAVPDNESVAVPDNESVAVPDNELGPIVKKKWACYWQNKTNTDKLKESFIQIKEN